MQPQQAVPLDKGLARDNKTWNPGFRAEALWTQEMAISKLLAPNYFLPTPLNLRFSVCAHPPTGVL